MRAPVRLYSPAAWAPPPLLFGGVGAAATPFRRRGRRRYLLATSWAPPPAPWACAAQQIGCGDRLSEAFIPVGKRPIPQRHCNATDRVWRRRLAVGKRPIPQRHCNATDSSYLSPSIFPAAQGLPTARYASPRPSPHPICHKPQPCCCAARRRGCRRYPYHLREVLRGSP